MAEELSLRYDEEGDILFIEAKSPYRDQLTFEVGDGILARTHPTTRAVDSIEIWNFHRRASGEAGLNLPVDLRTVIPVQTARAG